MALLKRKVAEADGMEQKIGLIEQARREWVAAEAEVKEFHAKHIQPLMEERVRLEHQLTLAQAAVKEAASLEELAAAKERERGLRHGWRS